jgi:hypothetical protein
MKNKLITFLAIATAPLMAKADISLVAGWDFGAFVLDGYAYTDPNFGSFASSIGANFSSIGGFNPVTAPVSTGTGTISWLPTDAENEFVTTLPGSNSVNTVMAVYPGTEMSNSNSDPRGLALGFTRFSGKSFDITVNMTGFADYNPADFGGFANFSFAAASEGNISIDWSLDGNSIGTSNLAAGNLSTFNQYTVDLPAAFYDAESTLRGVVNGSNTFAIDNVQFNGTVVPEPSTYAAIFGVIALGFAAYRRRKN